MRPLATNNLVLEWLYLCTPAEETSKWKRLASSFFGLITFASTLSGMLASVAFAWKYISIDLEETLYALCQIIGFGSITYAIIVIFFQRHSMREIFQGLSKIYTANESDESFQFIENANKKSEFLWRAYAVIKIAVVMTMGSMPLTSVVLWMINEHFDAKHVFHPFKLILPWNQSTPLGYFAEIFFILITTLAYMVANGSLILLFISMYLHHSAFYKRFQYTVQKFNSSDQFFDNKQCLCDLIAFQIGAKDWFSKTRDVYGPFILIQLFSSTLWLACSIFHLDLQLKHIDSDLTVVMISCGVSLSNLFLNCLFGELAMESYMKMSDCLYESNWLELNTNFKKYLVLMIANTQRPIFYHGFGITYLKLETFIKLLKTVGSYYMLFKTLVSK